MLEDLKKMYNYNLERYKNAIKIFAECSQQDFDKWLPEFLKIQDTLIELLDKILHYQNVRKYEIFNGFKI